MLADIKENVVLIDWVTFTTKIDSIATLQEELGLSHVTWTDFPGRGRYGYRDRMEFGSVNILYNGRDDMGICCEMSGQGCRTFEDHTTLSLKWESLFPNFLSLDWHLTRLDVALDDHTGVLDISRIFNDTISHSYVSRLRAYRVELSGKTDSSVIGTSVTFGSRSSMTLIRIYDKAAERGYDDGRHWVRVEMQMRDERAFQFLSLLQSMPVGEAFAGVLLNYLRFVEPVDSDSNKSRWVMTDYWAELCKDVSKIRLFVAPGGEYNVQNLENYCFNISGNAAACYIDMFGVDAYLDGLRHRSCKPSQKFELLKRQYDAEMERLCSKARLAFEFDETDELPAWGFTNEPCEELVPEWHECSETLPIFGCNTVYEQISMDL